MCFVVFIKVLLIIPCELWIFFSDVCCAYLNSVHSIHFIQPITEDYRRNTDEQKSKVFLIFQRYCDFKFHILILGNLWYFEWTHVYCMNYHMSSKEALITPLNWQQICLLFFVSDIPNSYDMDLDAGLLLSLFETFFTELFIESHLVWCYLRFAWVVIVNKDFTLINHQRKGCTMNDMCVTLLRCFLSSLSFSSDFYAGLISPLIKAVHIRNE